MELYEFTGAIWLSDRADLPSPAAIYQGADLWAGRTVFIPGGLPPEERHGRFMAYWGLQPPQEGRFAWARRLWPFPRLDT